MDDLLEIVADVIGQIIDAVLRTIKDPKKQKWAIRIFDGFCITALAAAAVWLFVDFYRKGNVIGAVVFTAAVVLAIVFIRVFIICSRKKRKKD